MSTNFDKLVLNRIRTPDGTVLTSYHRHDYNTHFDDNGLTYMIDGGLDYARRNLHIDNPYEELSVYLSEGFFSVRRVFHWSTYGPNGDQPIKYVSLSLISNPHIEAILKTQNQAASWVRHLLYEELEYRERVGFYIGE